mmetsp:Transcript_58479/g.174172  ORF Transcript_58479/g.174172 Transcript_58479/m.174172 type:complete len:233 (+) Transcript_58479:1148-1846(+)
MDRTTICEPKAREPCLGAEYVRISTALPLQGANGREDSQITGYRVETAKADYPRPGLPRLLRAPLPHVAGPCNFPSNVDVVCPGLGACLQYSGAVSSERSRAVQYHPRSSSHGSDSVGISAVCHKCIHRYVFIAILGQTGLISEPFQGSLELGPVSPRERDPDELPVLFFCNGRRGGRKEVVTNMPSHKTSGTVNSHISFQCSRRHFLAALKVDSGCDKGRNSTRLTSLVLE